MASGLGPGSPKKRCYSSNTCFTELSDLETAGLLAMGLGSPLSGSLALQPQGKILLASKEACSSESNSDAVNRDSRKFGRPCLAR